MKLFLKNVIFNYYLLIIYYFLLIINKLNNNLHLFNGDWGLGIGDWGLGIGDWAQSPIPISFRYMLIIYIIFFIIKNTLKNLK